MALAIHYPKHAVKSFLEKRFPETDWSVVIDQMPAPCGRVVVA